MLPDATIDVHDNQQPARLIDEVARAAGAVVLSERMRSKGNVVRRMFADVEADIYVMADGDATYDPAAAPAMVALVAEEGLDMIVGTRVHEAAEAYRRGHVLGNRMMTGILAKLFGRSFTDIFSGYRVFSRRFVKSFRCFPPASRSRPRSSVHALELEDACRRGRDALFRPARGIGSKLSTYRDGWRIPKTIAVLYQIERPMLFFGWIATVFAALAVGLSIPLAVTVRDRARAAFPHGDPGDGIDDPFVPQPVHRADPRHGGARAARGAAAGLSRPARSAQIIHSRYED